MEIISKRNAVEIIIHMNIPALRKKIFEFPRKN